MAPSDTQLSRGGTIGCQPIGADHLWTNPGVLQQLSEQTHRSLGIATFLDEHVEDLAERSFFRPLVERIARLFGFLRSFQGVRVQYYLALIFIALIGLLLWEVFVGI